MMLIKAKKVYQMALTVMQSSSDQDEEAPDLVLLAILNNLAELEAHFHAHDAMRAYLDCLKAILSDEDHDLTDEDLKFFFQNILLPLPLVAAAA
jgi:hypothetical protein